MRALFLSLLAVVAASLPAPTVVADPIGRHFDLTQLGGTTAFGGGLRLEGRPVKNALYMGARLGFQIHPMWVVEAAGGYTPTAERGTGAREADFFHASTSLMWTPLARSYGGPYLLAGAGVSQAKPSGGGGKVDHGSEIGGGLRFWLTDRVGLRVEMRRALYKMDDPGSGGGRIHPAIASGGIMFALGARPRDTDGDGVADRADACPETPSGAMADATGCPKDADTDGVPDGLDQSPDTPRSATVDPQGFPTDGDGDGVWDGLDRCANTPLGAAVDAGGCPRDSDGDGVWDGLDRCAETPRGATADGGGCPGDRDADGVPDGLDRCPETAAGLKVDREGCPTEVMEKETELLDTGTMRLEGVELEAGAPMLPAAIHPALDVVGQVLKQWPDLRVEIGAHTDPRGGEDEDRRRSETWAAAVAGYLIGRYPQLEPERFTTRGYGSSLPLVPGGSERSRMLNRRIEFVVLNKDVLRRASEDRRLGRVGAAAPR